MTSNPTKDWITNGGNVFNQRYSPLTLLDRDNVKNLKALWRTGMGTGAAPNNSGQARILHHQGTLFVINGANDVFALDADSGAILAVAQGDRNTMPAFGRVYSEADLRDVAAYITNVLTK